MPNNFQMNYFQIFDLTYQSIIKRYLDPIIYTQFKW